MLCLVCVLQISDVSLGGKKYTILIQIFKHGLIFFKNHSGFQNEDLARDLTFFPRNCLKIRLDSL